MRILYILITVTLVFFSRCSKPVNDTLYTGFVNPPAEARPFVRWWWNGNRITEKEIKRQLDVLHNAGIGGIEINPIALPEWSDTSGTRSLTWLSPEWNRLLALASEEAAKRDMITDLIVGSGWPFGGEFLGEKETVQRVIVHSLNCKGGDLINESFRSLLEKALKAQSRPSESEARSNTLLFIDLVPVNVKSNSEITDLSGKISNDGSFSLEVPPGEYQIIYGIIQRGHREVTGGAPGAAGPVMDHYKRDVTIAYLSRLKKISDDTGIPLSKLIRALFCDSIELAGSNWSDGFTEIFYDTYGYKLEPWFPFIFYESYRGYQPVKYDDKFRDELKRVRYDYNGLLVKVFLDNFTRTFQEFCTENGLKCRYQAYGTPFLMGMMEGNMIPDIPESNNWLYTINMDTDEWIWNQDHGYMIWNLYAASGGHLAGRKIISCEAMTNTRGVFKGSLEDIKRHDDMNFITGINHSILHGYNYSPVEAGFPGWVRFGEYFSEQNTWWPYFSKWTGYNARLSYIFQQSKPVKDIAILGPTGDIWSEKGLPRVPFHKEPWYCYRLWEPLSQSGSSCDYIDESIIINGKKEDGLLKYGPMSYQAVILSNVRSVEAETAIAIKDFVAAGGKLVIVDGVPKRSLSYQNAESNDRVVNETFDEILAKYPGRIFVADGPESQEHLLAWTMTLLERLGIRKDALIAKPDKNVFQIRQVCGNKDIWFFVNSNKAETAKLNAEFPVKGKTPWIWNPEDGSRIVFPFGKNENNLAIELQPLESLLLVFDPENTMGQGVVDKPGNEVAAVISGPWKAGFSHCSGKVFSRTFNELTEFGTSGDPELNSFAGTVKYLTEFESDGSGKWLVPGNVNKGVTEVFINGKHAGTNWYGKPAFRIDSLLKKGKNHLEIRYTSILSNYVRTLKDNPTAVRWTEGYDAVPAGLAGDVLIYK